MMRHLVVGARYRLEGTETIGRLARLEWDALQRREFGHLNVEDGRVLRIETRSLLGPRSYAEAVEDVKEECQTLVNKMMRTS